MNVHESIVVAVPGPQLQDIMARRFDEVARCLPGVREIAAEDQYRYRLVVEVKVGPLALSFKGLLELGEPNVTHAGFRMQSHLTDERTGSSVKLVQDIALHPLAEGTEIVLDSEVDLRGKIASLGWGLIRPKMRTMMRDFATNLQAFVERDAAQPLPSD
ncbi:hypothetical protein TPY_2011 [Sulfobacillus acidophilus TPY]|uniref:Carbon monoxide dehydrogenase subunit G n=1 Tax=Sulfobacillus acidophilus (strain ATCC 700253 / DSM 10332 / NAL) TaxID=679936 RepID=G8TTL0_SULAD|nr:hypothetical protein TPY_2011 [Sulfobacillus acidophilus TPY]AEW05676.1 carbon monoxide dehydrogenase subunit G [Sulfobacillus acidophilus DSM 10332]